MTKIPLTALEIAMTAVNAGQDEMSYLEHILTDAKAMGYFDGSLNDAVQVLKLHDMEVI